MELEDRQNLILGKNCEAKNFMEAEFHESQLQ